LGCVAAQNVLLDFQQRRSHKGEGLKLTAEKIKGTWFVVGFRLR